jgi:hypothetical protein
MGMLLKSAIGLGLVYIAMFAPAIRTADLGPAANLCGAAVQARIAGDESLRARWVAAGCAAKVIAEAQRATSAPAPKLVVLSQKPAAPPPPPAKALSGTLTAADLAEPWFGPGRIPRKSANRG